MSSFTHPQASVPSATGASSVPVYYERGVRFVTPELESLLSLWTAKAGARKFPARDDFSIRDLKSVLRNLVIMDKRDEGAGRRYFVRYMGSELDTQILPMTGHYADEVLPEYFRVKWQALWGKALELGVPMRTLSRAEFRERKYAYVESFYAGLSDDGAVPNKFMAAVYYHQIDSGTARMRQHANVLKLEFDQAPTLGIEQV